MIDMTALLSLQGQLILLMLIGFLLRKVLFAEAFQKGFTDLIVELILPCNIITSFQIEMNAALLKSSVQVIGVSLLNQIICILLGLILYRSVSEERLPALRYGTLCSNAGFLGTPVAEGIWGSQGTLLTALFLIPQRICMWTVGVSFFHQEKGHLLKRILRNRCIDAVLIGLTIMVFQIQLPEVLNRTISSIGRCNTAMSMLLIGMIASRIRLRDFANPTVLYYCFIRLILVPGITLVLCRLLHTDALTASLSTILVAMPAGATTAVLAEKYSRDPEFAVSCMATSTILSAIAIPLWGLLI